MKATTLNKGSIIFLSSHRGALGVHWEIVKESDKAINIEHELNHKTMWLPKSALQWDETYLAYHIKPWFLAKMQNWQISLLQS